MKNNVSISKIHLGDVSKNSIPKFRPNRGAIVVCAVFIGCAMYGQDALSDGLDGVSSTFRDSWWPKIKVIAYILAGVFALFGLVNVFKQSQRGEDNVGKVAGAWAGSLAVFLLGIWAVDTFIIAAAV